MPATPPPRLRPWSRIWRYGLAASIALLTWTVVAVDALPEDPSVPVDDRIGAFLLIDLVLGFVALCLVPFRRRWPMVVATVTALLTTVSASAVGAAALAAVSMSTWRRWRWVLVSGTAWGLATWLYEVAYHPNVPGTETSAGLALASGALAVVGYAACVATGFYIGARRDLVVSLQERAETAEREQALKADAAREAERTRIAREMHDVLAHRISLVAMHAGAMAYRTDLTREQTTQAAGVIQANAHLALTELRQVLGVLRTADGGGGAEPPQPTLTELPALLADVRDAGTEVELDVAGLPGGDVSALSGLAETVARTAFRILQEALTNACKHAPDETVRVVLAGTPGSRLSFEVRNRLPDVAVGAVPGAGMGLMGLGERADLAGGSLRSGPERGMFVVAGWLPWS